MFHTERRYEQTIHHAAPRFPDAAGVYIDILGVFESHGDFDFQQFARANAVHAVLAGEGELVRDGKVFTARKGDLFILRQGEFHHYRDAPARPWTYVYFHLNGPAAGAALDDIGWTADQPVVRPPEKSRFWAELDHLRRGFGRNEITGFGAIAAAWNMLELLEEIVASGREPHSTNPAEAAKRIIDQSPWCVSNVDDLTRRLNTSRATLFRRFKERYGVSVKHYMEDVRFDRIEELITRTELPIGEIARIGGFNDPLYFSRAFKKRFGIAPSEKRTLRPNT